jgi:hypothetical protein
MDEKGIDPVHFPDKDTNKYRTSSLFQQTSFCRLAKR